MGIERRKILGGALAGGIAAFGLMGASVRASGGADAMTLAEVRKIDRATQRITLRHEEIRSLDMPPMTMVFGVSHPALLEGLSVGMTVRFRAERHEGSYRVTAIEAAR